MLFFIIQWTALWGVCLSFVIMLVLNILPEAWLEDYIEAYEAVSSPYITWTFLAAVLVAPVVEEVIFRGLILSRLQKAMPVWAAILISSIVFAWAHGQIVWAMHAFVGGLLMSCVAVRYKSIAPTIVLHMAFNFIGTVMEYLIVPDIVIWIWIGCSVVGFFVVGYILFKPEIKERTEK